MKLTVQASGGQTGHCTDVFVVNNGSVWTKEYQRGLDTLWCGPLL